MYVSYDGLTDPLGQSQVLPYLIGLSQLNYEITVLSTEKNENFLKNNKVIKGICGKYDINWTYINYSKKPPVVSTIKDVLLLKKKAKSLNKVRKFKIVHCRSYIAALLGLWMQKKFGTKFIFDMRGFWADERVDGNIWNLRIPIFKKVYNYFKEKEKSFLLNADEIVSLTFTGKDEFLTWDYLQEKSLNVSVIPCCADLEHFDFDRYPRDEQLKKKMGIPIEDDVICYLGSVGTWYMMEEMLDYFKAHLSICSNSTFLWITKDNPDSILDYANSIGVGNKIVIQPAERNELPNLLSIVDVSIFFIKPLFSKKASSPTKMAELLGMGIPIICNHGVGDTDGIVEQEDVGLVVKEFSEKEFISVAKQLENLKQINKNHLRCVAEKYFSLKNGVEGYAKIYNRLTNN